jgi:hypothetical protein
MDERGDLALGEIAEKVRRDLRDEARTKHSIEVEKLAPRDVVWIVITNAIAETLPLGNYHTYRGMLNFMGTQLYALWGEALSQLEKSGANTPEKTKEERSWMNEQIRNAG